MSRARSRTVPLLAVLALVAVAWAAGWWAAAGLAQREMDKWLAREAAGGRRWSCPGRTVTGFPFALTVGCERPTFAGEVVGHDSDGALERLEASVALMHPVTAVMALRGPLTLRARDEAFLVAFSWGSLTAAVPLGLSSPTGGEVSATRLAVSGSAPAQGDLNLRAAAITGSVQAVDGMPADRRFAFTATGVSFPTADLAAIMGNDPLEAEGSGVLAGAALLSNPTVARLEAWRQAGGALRLDELRFVKGSFSGSARGKLALDEAHRPAGTLDLSLVGFEPLAKRLGIPVAGVKLGGLLASVLGGREPAPAVEGALPLPLTLGQGQVQLGPFPLGVRLAPLY